MLLAFFMLQVSYIIIKYVNIRMVVDGSLTKRLVISSIANVVWLASTSFGVNEVIEGNYLVFLVYVCANICGTLLEHKIRIYI